MLVWSRGGRILAWSIGAALFAVVYVVPFAVILLASLAGQWNGLLPSHLTLANFSRVASGATGKAVWVSIATGFLASGIAILLGTAAALSLRSIAGRPRRVLDLLFFLPSAIPSVSVGLGLLVAFSRPPLLLNGTTAIVVAAHLVLVSAFAYGNVAAGLMRLPPDYEQIAASLGARPAYRLLHVTLPLISPYLAAAFSLSFALSMGELGATVMVYPPGWVTMPVGIFALTDRGDVFRGAALTVILIAITMLVLLTTSSIRPRVSN